jgi:hypothetical protein
VKARENPFRSDRVLSAIRYEGPHGGAETLVARLEALHFRAAIVGPHGSGKTTLLEDIEPLLAGRGFRVWHVRLDTDHRRLPADWRARASGLDGRDIVCLDGAELLGPLAWRRFRWSVRRAGGLMVTSHRSGRLPTLVTCATSVELLQRIISRLTPAPIASAPPATDLFARHGGNLRDALRELYDVYGGATMTQMSMEEATEEHRGNTETGPRRNTEERR